MNKYYNFEDFMQSVIECANKKSLQRYGKDLSEVYNVAVKVIAISISIIESGWGKFVAVVTLLALGPFAFGLAFMAFVGNPVGIAVGVALAAYGGVSVVKFLYKNRKLPLAIKNTGDSFKELFENHIGQIAYIDNLIDQAAEYLLSNARN